MKKIVDPNIIFEAVAAKIEVCNQKGSGLYDIISECLANAAILLEIKMRHGETKVFQYRSLTFKITKEKYSEGEIDG